MKDLASHAHGSGGTIFTIGHSTCTLSELMDLLRKAQIELLVDVRSVPRSRTNPQFNVDALPEALATAGIGYVHLPALGGLRHRRKPAMPSPNALWQNASFRNYADYAGTEAFRVGVEELEALARDKRCAIMCAEAVWWRCHRQSSPITCWLTGFPWRTSWGPARSFRRRSRPALECYLAAR